MTEFVSTRNNKITANAWEAVFNGIAPDGGLYVPVNVKSIDVDEVLNLSYAETAKIILRNMLPSFTDKEISESCDEAYLNLFDVKEVAPVVKVGEGYIAELFHGETFAFKDVALSVLPRLMTRARKSLGHSEKILILTATSGDTGSAAMNGFRDVEGTGIITFFPKNGVSDIQKAQMTCMEGGNLTACAVYGNFDDCQTTVKKMFAELKAPEGIHLSSANSINIARLAPQITYYYTAYVSLVKSGEIQMGDKIDFVVPTGNFGDILAGFYAKRMGLPVGKLVCASNANRVLTDFIETGIYDKRREFKKTISPSMDILISSNLERLIYLAEGENDAVVASLMKQLSDKGFYKVSDEALTFIRESFEGASYSDEEALEEIRKTFKETGYLLDPHTAVAYAAFRMRKQKNRTVILSTASPYKFPDSVLKALGCEIPENAFDRIRLLEKVSGTKAPAGIKKLENAAVVSKDETAIENAFEYVYGKAETICRN